MQWDLIVDRRVAEIPERHGCFVIGGLEMSTEELDYCVEMLSIQSGLKGVFFEGCSIDNDGLEILLQLFKDPKLEQIGLVDNNIDDKGILNLVEALLSVNNSKLKNLYLKRVGNVGELGASALILLKSSRHNLKIEGLPIPGLESKPDFKDIISDIKKRLHLDMPINEAFVFFKDKLRRLK